MVPSNRVDGGGQRKGQCRPAWVTAPLRKQNRSKAPDGHADVWTASRRRRDRRGSSRPNLRVQLRAGSVSRQCHRRGNPGCPSLPKANCNHSQCVDTRGQVTGARAVRRCHRLLRALCLQRRGPSHKVARRHGVGRPRFWVARARFSVLMHSMGMVWLCRPGRPGERCWVPSKVALASWLRIAETFDASSSISWYPCRDAGPQTRSDTRDQTYPLLAVAGNNHR